MGRSRKDGLIPESRIVYCPLHGNVTIAKCYVCAYMIGEIFKDKEIYVNCEKADAPIKQQRTVYCPAIGMRKNTRDCRGCPNFNGEEKKDKIYINCKERWLLDGND